MRAGRDRAFVACSWGGSYRDYAPLGSWPSPLARRHRNTVDCAMDEQGVLLAVLPSSPDTIHAWACVGDGGVLHYVYVAGGVRGHGIARALITAALGEYPERIVTSHPWPRKSGRYVQKIRSAA